MQNVLDNGTANAQLAANSGSLSAANIKIDAANGIAITGGSLSALNNLTLKAETVYTVNLICDDISIGVRANGDEERV